MNEQGSFEALFPLIIFMVVMVGVSIFVRHKQAEKNFVGNYFIGNRSIGVWFFAIFISFILSRKFFTDINLGGEGDE